MKAILGRKSDKSGKKYWLNILKKGSRSTIVQGLCNSVEFNNKCKKLGIL